MADSFTLAIPHEQLAAKAKEAGIDPNATSGTLPEVQGVQLSYHVIAGTKSLTAIQFTVVKKPRLIPVSVIKNRVKSLLGV